MTLPVGDLLQQLTDIDRQLDSLVTSQDIQVMRKSKDLIPKIMVKLQQAERAGINISSIKQSIENSQRKIDQFLSVYE